MSAWIDLARGNAAIFVVAAFLVGGALTSVLPSGRAAWLIAALSCLLATVASVDLAVHGLGAAPPAMAAIHVVLSYDGLNLFSVMVVTSAAALAMIGAYPGSSHRAAYPLSLSLVGAGSWVAALFGTDFISVFLCVEAAWLAAVAVVSLSHGTPGALNGAFRMLCLGGASAALFLLGTAFLVGATGSASLAAVAREGGAHAQLAATGCGLILVALAIKSGVAPFYQWAAAALSRADGLACMVIGGVSSVAGLALMVRFLALALSSPSLGESVSTGAAALGAVSVVVGSAQALGATNLRRLAGYALAIVAGGVLMSAALGSPAGYSAALVQLVSFVAAALGLLGGAAAAGARTLTELDGLARRAPLASAGIAVSAMSLMGAPMTIGFLGRWRMVEAGIGAGWWWAAGAMIIASLAGVFFGGRLIERMYFRRAERTAPSMSNLGWFYAPALIASIAVTAIGLAPTWLLELADAAAALLAGTTA